jgi:hypothetical protein
MSKQIPSMAGGILIPESGTSIVISEDTQRWLQWLESAQSFRYIPESSDAPFTARKEKSDYWYAYRKMAGKLHKRYIGKPGELTLERLEEVASLLNEPSQPRPEKTPQELPKPELTKYVTNDDITRLWEAITALQVEVQALVKPKAR